MENDCQSPISVTLCGKSIHSTCNNSKFGGSGHHFQMFKIIHQQTVMNIFAINGKVMNGQGQFVSVES